MDSNERAATEARKVPLDPWISGSEGYFEVSVAVSRRVIGLQLHDGCLTMQFP